MEGREFNDRQKRLQDWKLIKDNWILPLLIFHYDNDEDDNSCQGIEFFRPKFRTSEL